MILVRPYFICWCDAMAYITVDVYSTSKGANGKKETCQKNREEWDTTSIMQDTTSTKGKKNREEWDKEKTKRKSPRRTRCRYRKNYSVNKHWQRPRSFIYPSNQCHRRGTWRFEKSEEHDAWWHCQWCVESVDGQGTRRRVKNMLEFRRNLIMMHWHDGPYIDSLFLICLKML